MDKPAELWNLVIRQAGKPEAIYPLARRTLVIGRGSQCDVIIDDAAISRQHARLIWYGNGYTLEDLNSANGTWLNGQRLTIPAPLRNRDTVTLGKELALVILAPGESLTPSTAQPPMRTPSYPPISVPPSQAGGWVYSSAPGGAPPPPAAARSGGGKGCLLLGAGGLAILVVILLLVLAVLAYFFFIRKSPETAEPSATMAQMAASATPYPTYTPYPTPSPEITNTLEIISTTPLPTASSAATEEPTPQPTTTPITNNPRPTLPVIIGGNSGGAAAASSSSNSPGASYAAGSAASVYESIIKEAGTALLWSDAPETHDFGKNAASEIIHHYPAGSACPETGQSIPRYDFITIENLSDMKPTSGIVQMVDFHGMSAVRETYDLRESNQLAEMFWWQMGDAWLRVESWSYCPSQEFDLVVTQPLAEAMYAAAIHNGLKANTQSTSSSSGGIKPVAGAITVYFKIGSDGKTPWGVVVDKQGATHSLQGGYLTISGIPLAAGDRIVLQTDSPAFALLFDCGMSPQAFTPCDFTMAARGDLPSEIKVNTAGALAYLNISGPGNWREERPNFPGQHYVADPVLRIGLGQ